MDSCRVERTQGYTVMSNYHLRDTRLSLKSVGLLSKMLSLPPEWDYTIRGLSNICKEGRDAIRAAIEELEEAGYVRRSQKHAENGRFVGNEYVIYESPLPENPSAVFPLTENTAQINKDILNTKLYTPPIVPPQGETPEKPRRRSRKTKEAPDWKPERFEKFWEAYPKGKSKQAAISAWDALKPDDSMLHAMALGLMRDMGSDQWKDPHYIPHASTWINQRRWEDEPDKPVAPTPSPLEEVPVW